MVHKCKILFYLKNGVSDSSYTGENISCFEKRKTLVHIDLYRFLYHGRIVIGDSNLENTTVT